MNDNNIEKWVTLENYVYNYTCPNCHTILSEVENCNYCPECGTRLDWSKNEENDNED